MKELGIDVKKGNGNVVRTAVRNHVRKGAVVPVDELIVTKLQGPKENPKRKKDQKETEILEVIDQVENHSSDLTSLTQEVTSRQEVLDKLRTEVQAEIAEQMKKLHDLQAQRQEIQKNIPKQLLKRYDFIREKRQGIAITGVRNGVCLACHMNLPPQKFIELQMDKELMTCPHCQRIIYFTPHDENGNSDPAEAA
jgi:predicted  nucleic acid-binding Zn-ribbon protein